MTVLSEEGKRICSCARPSEHVNPAKKGKCVAEDALLDDAWMANDRTSHDFWTALEAGMFPGEAPEWFFAFKAKAVARERAGRDTFGFEYLSPDRDNLAEAVEELADFVIYLSLESLKQRRMNDGVDEDFDVVLSSSALAVRAFEQLQRLRHKRRGAA